MSEDEIAELEAALRHASAIAACSIGQADRAERVADREHARRQLDEARCAASERNVIGERSHHA